MYINREGYRGKNHWVNIFKLVASEKLNSFGGGTSIAPSLIGYWDPATGNKSYTDWIVFFKAYMF